MFGLNPPEQVNMLVLDTDFDNWLIFYFCNDAPRSRGIFSQLSYHVITRTPDGSMPKEAKKMLDEAEKKHLSHINKKSYYYSTHDNCVYNQDLV